MRMFRNLPIKWKLMLATLTTSAIALLLLGSSLFFIGLPHLRNLAVQETAALAERIGRDCAGKLEAGDAKATQAALNDAVAMTPLEEACVYTADGRLFARYTRHDVTPEPFPSMCKVEESFAGSRLTLCRPIKHRNRMVGTLCVRSDTGILRAWLKDYLGMGFLVMGISMLVALIFASRLQRLFSGPILELTRVAHTVAQRKDFSQRAAKLSKDETGTLTDAFNQMLATIQEHDSGSRASQSRLEMRVAERTMELQKANEALREREERLQAVLENSLDVAYRRNLQTDRYDFFSPAVEKVTGYSTRELTGKSLDFVLSQVHPDDLLAGKHVLKKAQTGEATNGIVEYRFRHKDGNYRWLSDRFTVVKDADGRPLYWVGVSRDVTEQKRMEEALLESEDRYRSLFATSMDAVLLGTTDGRILAANAAACRMFGLTEEELIRVGRNRITDVSDPRLQAATAERERTGVFYSELTFIRNDGTKFPAEVSSVVFRVQKGDRRASMVIRDITERKRAEEALRTLNETLEQRVAERTALADQRTQEMKEAQHVAHVSNWIWDVETGNLVWSEELFRICGLDPKRHVPSIQEHLRILTPESSARWHAAAEQTLRTGAPHEVDLELIRPDGMRRWINVHGEVMVRNGDRVTSLRGTAQDITERKQAEEALRASEEKFRRIAGHIQDVLYSVDMETREFRYLSPVFERIFGYSLEDIQNMGGRIAFLKKVIEKPSMSSDDRRRRLERLKAQPKEGITIRDEEWWRCKDGSLKCVEDRWLPVYEAGRLTGTDGVLCDITERRRAEEALRESEERYRSLVNNLNVGVYRNTPDGRYLQANPALARMHGYDSVDEFLKANVVDFYENSVDRETFLAHLLHVDAATGYQVRVKRKNGTSIFCAVTAAVHRGPDGRVEWIDGIVEDITERKRLEDQLLEISEREQRRIGQDLHDGLCQHLAGVGFMSKALAQKLAASSPAESADARAVANLIRQAITEARGIATGLHPVKKEANSVMVALQGLADNLKSMFRVQCVFTCEPPVLIENNTAATHLYRIAQEAVNNAIRHGKAKRVWITLAETGRQITLTVKDDGKGISLPLPATRGIGMDIMNHRARVIGGTLNIHRAPKGGTILTCSFPKKNAA